jgi:hypothetical protein
MRIPVSNHLKLHFRVGVSVVEQIGLKKRALAKQAYLHTWLSQRTFLNVKMPDHRKPYKIQPPPSPIA